MRGSISHSSLATSSGQHQSNAAVLLMETSLTPSLRLKERGPEASERERWNMQDPWSWLGERLKETGASPMLHHPLFGKGNRNSLIHAILA